MNTIYIASPRWPTILVLYSLVHPPRTSGSRDEAGASGIMELVILFTYQRARVGI